MDLDAVKKTAEERIRAAKARSHCSACGQRGHWHRDAVCPKLKNAPPKEDRGKPQTVHISNEIFELQHVAGGHLLAITDSACSKSVMGTAWLQKYLDVTRGKIAKPDFINEQDAFKFGASRVYESSYAAVILLMIDGNWIAVKASVVHGDVPLLLSRPALGKLGMVLDLANNTADFRALKVKDFALHSTSTGHPAIPVIHEGQLLPSCSGLPKVWPNEGVVILKMREPYTSFVVSRVGSNYETGQDYSRNEASSSRVNPKIFYDKKLDPAVQEMLVADTLNVERFLQWWSSTNISNDFWLETDEALVRIHITPRKAPFDPRKWQTVHSLQRDLLLHALGDVRETCGIACTSQRSLPTYSDLWRDQDRGSYSVLWIGRSIFNRAHASLPPVLTRHEREAHSSMEDEPRRALGGVHPEGHFAQWQLDGDRAEACAELRQRCHEGEVPTADRTGIDEPGPTPGQNGQAEYIAWTQGHQRLAPPQDPRHGSAGGDGHDPGQAQGARLQGRPDIVCRMGTGGVKGEQGQHAPRPVPVRDLVPGQAGEGQAGGHLYPQPPQGRDRRTSEGSAAIANLNYVVLDLCGQHDADHPEERRQEQGQQGETSSRVRLPEQQGSDGSGHHAGGQRRDREAGSETGITTGQGRPPAGAIPRQSMQVKTERAGIPCQASGRPSLTGTGLADSRLEDDPDYLHNDLAIHGDHATEDLSVRNAVQCVPGGKVC